MDAILLAAGNSVRFGRNKLLFSVDGKPVYRYLLEELYKGKKRQLLNQVIVVTQYEEIISDIEENFPGLEAVTNPAPEKGVSGSIRLGLEKLRLVSPDSEGCLFAVADQPGLTFTSLDKLIGVWRRNSHGIAAASHNTESKNPVIFSSKYYEELNCLEGDQGGKRIMHRHMGDVELCEIPAIEMEDMDTPEDVGRIAESFFPFLGEQGHVISIVGAGGKTTLMYTLAHWFGERGRKVIVTTTTHIQRPLSCPVAEDKEELKKWLRLYPVVVAGTDALEGKLIWPKKMDMSDLQEIADVILIEADGAKHFPCKVPAETEPVIPKESDLVLGVMGVDAIGACLGDVCFRKEKGMELLKTDSRHVLTEEDLAEILASEQGTRKGVENRAYHVILNKCDDKAKIKQAEQVKRILKEKGVANAVSISLKNLTECAGAVEPA